MPVRRHNLLATTLAAVTVILAGCGGDAPQPPSLEAGGIPAEWPGADDARHAEGRAVWLADCENCHGIGKAGSPRFTDAEAWAPRVAKGEEVLIASAINGFEGKTEAGMPPRGGNEDLTDDQVAAAVRYMIHFSRPVPDGSAAENN